MRRVKLPQLRFITGFAKFLARYIPGYRRLPFIVQKFIACLLVVTTTLTSISFGFLFNPFNNNEVEAVWFNENWGYRAPITLTNNGSVLSDTSVMVTINTSTLVTAGKLQSDCDDLRFADFGGNIIPYFIEAGCNTTATLVWLYPNSLSAGSSSIYAYYGNPSASAGSFYQEIPYGINPGNGADGTVTLAATTDLNTTNIASGRSCADGGDAVNYRTTSSLSAGATTVTLSSTPSSGCLAVGDEVLIINLQGTTGNISNVGKYEFARITNISTATLTLNHPLANGYDGTTQKIMVQRVPNYSTFTINAARSLTPSAWSNASGKGGVLAMRVSGTLTLSNASASINANGLGYIGGTAGAAGRNGGANGESYDGSVGQGATTNSVAAASGGGRSGNNAVANPANGATRGGGGGGGSVSGSKVGGAGGGGGGGGHAFGGGGGGGGATGTGASGTGGTAANGNVNAGGGGGARNSTGNAAGGAGGNAGSNGGNATGTGGSAGSSTTSGSGGGGGNNATNATGAGGGGGGSYAASAPTVIYMGSGGGGGGSSSAVAGTDGQIGGGIIMVAADTVASLTGTISADGVAAVNASAGGGSGGAGAGGTVYVSAKTSTLGTSRVSAAGGARATSSGLRAGGGAGGNGRAFNSYSTSSGTAANPTLTSAQYAIAGSVGTEEKALTPTAYWRLDEGVGTTANNSINNVAPGTLTNTPTWQTEDMCVSGKCLLFNGTDEYVTMADNPALEPTTAMSMSAWIKRSGANGTRQIFMGKGDGNDDTTIQYWLELNTSNQLAFILSSGGDDTFIAATDLTITDQNWHFVTGTWDGSTMRIYLDGVVSSVTGSFTGPITGTSINFSFGRMGTLDDYYFKGFIDEVKLYNYARSAEQVRIDYNSLGDDVGSSSVVSNPPNNQPGALSDNLTGYWKFNEGSGTSVTDYSGNGTTLTSTGSPSYSAGKFDTALTYNGSSNYSASGTLPTTATSNFTVSAWVYPETLTGEQLMIYNGKDDAGWGFGINSSTGGTGALVGLLGAVAWVDSGYDFPSANQWYHVTMTRDSESLRFYVNGVLQSGTSTSTPNTPSTSGKFAVGAETDSNGSTIFRHYDGRVDEVRVYQRSLSAGEAAALYNFGPTPTGYWAMEEASWTANCSTASVLDTSGNGLNGQACPNSTGPTGNGIGKYGKGGVFDGSDDYVSVADNVLLEPANDMTLMAWVKVDQLPSTRGEDMALFYKLHSSDPWFSYQFYIRQDSPINRVCWDWSNSSGSGFEECSSTAITANTWYHLAAVKSGTEMSLYINGIKEATENPTASGTILNSSGALALGSVDGTQKTVDGNLDEMKIYNYARSTAQIIQDMNAGHPAGGSPVGSQLGYWKFDEGYGTTANNSGTASLNGTLTNMAAPATSTSGWNNSGKFGRSLSFDGSNDYVALGTPSLGLTGNASYTISAWVNPTSTTHDGCILSYGAASSNHVISICSDSSGKIYSVHYSNDHSYNTSWALGSWQHVAITYDGTTERLYVNGAYRESWTPTALNLANGETMYIGRASWSGTYVGASFIDEVKLYGAALSADQVAIDYNRGSAQVLAAVSTASDGVTPSFGIDRSYCVPGSTTTCGAPEAEFKFEEGSGTDANDTSGNNHTAAYSGNTVRSTGKYGKALTFDGTGDYVSTADAASLDFASGEDFSIAFWMKRDSGVDSAFMVSKGAGGTSDPGYTVYLDSGQLPVLALSRSGEGSRLFISSPTAIDDNDWHHVVVTADRDGNATIYQDGIVTVADSISSYNGFSLANSYGLTLACYDGGVACFDGSMDNVRLYRRALTNEQVQWEYSQGAPVAHWKMDECQGTVINDSSGNNLTAALTIGGSGSQTTVGTCATSGAWFNGVTGKRNYSMSFDGNDDLIQLTNSATINPFINPKGAITGGGPDFTMAAWIKSSTTSTWMPIISNYNAGGTTGYLFTFTSGGELACDKTNVTSLSTSDDLGNAILNGQWHHVACVTNSSGMYLYIDGVLRASNSDTTAFVPNANSVNLTIGYNAIDGDLFTGLIDDTRLYQYGLTAAQIKTLYNQGAINYGPVTGAP